MRLRAVDHGDVLVIESTSDARAICQQLDAAGVRYALPVTTPTNERLADDIHGWVHYGRTEQQQMAEWLKVQRARWMIDASRPCAEMVSQNIIRACASIGVLFGRCRRPEQPGDLRHPLLHMIDDLNKACALACRLGERILLTTGSKDLAAWRAELAEKTLLTWVLPIPEVIQYYSDLGFSIGEIFAPCGLFSVEFNATFYRQCRTDIVVTKASGAEGGYQERVQPCLDAGVPCIVITRPAPLVKSDELLEGQTDFTARLTCWLSAI